MQCFFYGEVRKQKPKFARNGMATFCIPDLGLIFRAQFSGTKEECQYAALLSLLEFVELNPNLFKNKTLEIFGDSFIVVHQVNMKMVCNKALEPYRNMALVYRRKFTYSLDWIPETENPAQRGLTIQ